MNMWEWFKRCGKLALVLALVFTAGAFAADAAPTAEVANRPWSIWDIVLGVLVFIGAWGGTAFSWAISKGQKKFAKDEAQNKAWEALNAGVTTTYETLYKQFKNDATGGITTEEAKQLRDNAIQAAKDIATGPGLEVLKTTALPILHDWVQQIVLKRKTQAE